jgi:hypothetical protein
MTILRRDNLIPILVAALVLTMLYALWLAGAAHAGTTADPVAAATTATDSGWQLVRQYGWLWGGVLLTVGLGGSLLKDASDSAWFKQGKRLAIVTSALGVLGAVAQWHFNGAPLEGVLVTAIMALKLVWSPTVTPLPAVRTPQAGRARLGMMTALAGVGIVGGVALTSCGPKSTAIIDAALDCTTQARTDLVAALVPTAESAIQKIADPSGKVSVEALEALFAGASLKSEAGVIVACAEAKAIALLGTLLAAPRVAGAPPPLDVNSLRLALAVQFPGVSFRTGP